MCLFIKILIMKYILLQDGNRDEREVQLLGEQPDVCSTGTYLGCAS